MCTQEWPIHGGEWGAANCSYPEIIVTGSVFATVCRYVSCLSHALLISSCHYRQSSRVFDGAFVLTIIKIFTRQRVYMYVTLITTKSGC